MASITGELVEKVWRFLQSLSVAEVWQLIGAASALGGSIALATFKFARLLKPGSTTVVTGDPPGTVEQLRKELATRDTDIIELRTQATHIDELKAALESGIDEQALWKFRSVAAPQELLDRINASHVKVLTFTNYKGGVGKTTLAANLGAYFAEQGKRVLMIDFDYQGSLSTTVLLATGREEAQSHADRLLAGTLTAAELVGHGFSLPPDLPQVALVPAGNALNAQEARLAMRWFLKMDDADPRFALLRLISHKDVLTKYDMVIIDTPPRLSLATINALAASTHFAVPTKLDSMSAENIGNLLNNVDTIFRKGLNPNIRLAGIIGTMTEQKVLKDREVELVEWVRERAVEKWGPDTHVFKSSLPDTTRFREDAGRAIAYLDTKATNSATRATIDAVGRELTTRLVR